MAEWEGLRTRVGEPQPLSCLLRVTLQRGGVSGWKGDSGGECA